MTVHLALIDEPRADLCALPARDRFCVALSCASNLSTQLPLEAPYHFTRCARDGVVDAAPGFRPLKGERRDCGRYGACLKVHQKYFVSSSPDVPGSCAPNCAWFIPPR